MHSPSRPIYTPDGMIALKAYEKGVSAPPLPLLAAKRGPVPIQESDVTMEQRMSCCTERRPFDQSCNGIDR